MSSLWQMTLTFGASCAPWLYASCETIHTSQTYQTGFFARRESLPTLGASVARAVTERNLTNCMVANIAAWQLQTSHYPYMRTTGNQIKH